MILFKAEIHLFKLGHVGPFGRYFFKSIFCVMKFESRRNMKQSLYSSDKGYLTELIILRKKIHV